MKCQEHRGLFSGNFPENTSHVIKPQGRVCFPPSLQDFVTSALLDDTVHIEKPSSILLVHAMRAFQK